MNTYDPMTRIVYRHMAPWPPTALLPSSSDCHALPAGYANGSPRTRFRRTLALVPLLAAGG